eukprot:CAMPEP_0197702222 /NCGR_PEP_ID=MMETSP1338-20131121/124241_1 /TAXON_ID=43686 ORGANISM="Pelagodinium beii, Strain RCC1491" /NCGR_SAMPLE_ID=MMETSP1338 /ASSEMBLY_ACC=CAM_ASM_000754 /LENGTH=196 /DNA_ID=CAMNT_0043286027 /DNA_START=39 /DNA_END=626 /DNA_ORIENTATION=-
MTVKMVICLEDVSAALERLDEAYGGRSLITDLVISNEDARTQMLQKTNLRGLNGLIGLMNPAHYGEIAPLAFCQLLHEVQAEAGEMFYDLGSGNGKLVALAWLLGLDVTGVEIIRERHETAMVALETLRKGMEDDDLPSAPIRFICGSFLDVDFSDADIVYTWDLLFDQEMKEDIAVIAQKLKPGSRVISSRGLPI